MGLIMQMKNKLPLDRLLKKLAPKMVLIKMFKGAEILTHYNSYIDHVILSNKGKTH